VSSLTEIVDGLATRLKTIAAFDLNVLTEARRPPVFPAAIIIPPAVPDYGDCLAGTGAQLAVTILVLAGVIEAEQQASLFPFLDWTGPSSIARTIENSRGLGLDDVDCRVVSSGEPGSVELPDGTVCYGVPFNLNIFAA
jgi:hypothetical protein